MNGRTKDENGVQRFRLARMCTLVRTLTLVILALPLVFLVAALLGTQSLAIPALFLIAIYAWVWFWFRPTRFAVHPGGLQVIWPLRSRHLPQGEISSVRVMDKPELEREIGWGLRVGAGGLWGAFGWLWTKRRGMVRMYVSRTDHFVWIERVSGRPWLITPEEPEAFVRALSRQ